MFVRDWRPQLASVGRHTLNSLKGVQQGIIQGIIFGVIKGDTRSLDYSSYAFGKRNSGRTSLLVRTWRVRGT